MTVIILAYADVTVLFSSAAPLISRFQGIFSAYHPILKIICAHIIFTILFLIDVVKLRYDFHSCSCIGELVEGSFPQNVPVEVLHADETTLQVLREPDKSVHSKSYMWLYRTGGHAAEPMILYEYRPDRKAVNAEKFLKDFSGWLHADGYPGYHSLQEHIRVVGCWAHLRRKFDEAVKSLPKQDQPTATALQGQAYCSKLFSIEQELAELPPEQRYTQRLERSKPAMDALFAWASTNTAAPKSALGKALYYLHEQWPYLIRVLEDGRLDLSNNLAERSIKPFVIGRKNFLFANTPHGAQDAAVIYSMIETAKASGLDPCRYLTWVLTNAPILAAKGDGWASELLPANAPPVCRSLQQNH